MSDAQRTIDIIFNGVDKTGAAVQGALGNVDKLSSSIVSATQPFENATLAAIKYEAAILAAGAAVTAFAVKTAADFQSGFAEISTLVDAPTESLDEFRQAIIDYAEGSVGSLSDVNSAVYNAISAGVDYADSLDVISEAEKLAIAGKGDLGDTLKVLVSSLNAYGLSTEEAGRFSDFLFTTVKEGQTTLPQLNASLAQVTATAANVGVPFDEILAAIAALTKGGTPTANAVNQINQVISQIISPTQQAAAAAAELGIEFSASALESKGLKGILDEVAQATGGSKDAIAELIPSSRALRGVLPLVGAQAQSFADILDSMGRSAGATEEAYEKLSNTLLNVGNRLGSSFEALLVSIGDPLLDSVGDVGNALGEIIGILTTSFEGGNDDITGALSGLTDFIEGEFDDLAEFLRGVAQALPAALESADLSGFQDGLTAVAEAVGSLFSDLDLTDANDLAQAITFIGESFEGLSRFVGGAIKGLEPLLRFLGELAVSASENADKADELGRAFGSLTALNNVAQAVGGVNTVLTGLLGVMALNQGANLIFASTRLAALLGGAGGVVALLGGLAAAVGGVQAAISVANGGDGDNFINSILNPLGGQDLSTYIVDAIFWLKELGAAAEESKDISLVPGGASGDELLSTVPALAGLYEEMAEGLYRVQEAAKPEAFDRFAAAQKKLNALAEESSPILFELGESFSGPSQKALELGEAMSQSAGTFSVVKNEAASAVDSLDAFADASDEVRARLAEAAIQASGAIRVAEIEASAERAVAAFESINTTIQSTGDLLGDLYGSLGDDGISKFDKLGIKEQIQAEAEARDKVLQKQEKLLSASIREANARAAAFARGDALIRVDGDGLQPHLEAFMFEILESIQLRVNQDGYQLLLGAM
jgi:TP901 family phage tail tape measure protein